MTETVYLPGLRGFFGDWTYYACLMPMAELARRVDFAREVHTSKGLSDMIQRQLEDERAPAIAKYLLTNEQRFFNSLVIAVYGGEPSWHEFGRITPQRDDIDLADVPEYARHSLGFLRFSGRERLFALDGQHRLYGIKEALKQDSKLGGDEISTIFVAHRKTKAGLRRTRRLFTTLNKTARPVSKSAVIALDESDVMAITVRRLVEEHPFFTGDRIVFKHTNNLSLRDRSSLTTIGNLYDVLERLFLGNHKGPARGAAREQLRFYRPEDPELEDFYKQADIFFRSLGEAFPEVSQFYQATDPLPVVEAYRGTFGGSMLFRPMGLIAMTEVILVLSAKHGFGAAFALAARLPTELAQEPYAGVLWDPIRPKVIASGAPLVRRLLLYMLGESSEPEDRLRADYARVLGEEVADISLPRRVVRRGKGSKR